MLQASLSLFLSQVSSVKYKLIIIMLKTLLIMPSFSMCCLPFISRRSKQKILRILKDLSFPVQFLHLQMCPGLLYLISCVCCGGERVCVVQIYFCKWQNNLDYYLKTWWNNDKIIFNVIWKRSFFKKVIFSIQNLKINLILSGFK